MPSKLIRLNYTLEKTDCFLSACVNDTNIKEEVAIDHDIYRNEINCM